MDKETLTNYIASLGKSDFESTCRLVLNKVFGFDAINVDEAYDGGSDFVVFHEDGKRQKVAYQITTQKTDIKNKAYKDAKKSLIRLGTKKYFFLCTYKLSEEAARKLENEIEGYANAGFDYLYKKWQEERISFSSPTVFVDILQDL